MSLIQLAILIIAIVAVIAIVGWFLKSSEITIPKPVLIALYAIAAILAILLVADVAGIGPGIIN